MTWIMSCSRCSFNPRSREGSDPNPVNSLKTDKSFQSTLPRRERLVDAIKNLTIAMFQSTLPRRERRGRHMEIRARPCFNPRSREGSDAIRRRSTGYRRCFNPRSREGSDMCQREQTKHSQQVSIHAPAKGATIR